MATCKGCKQHIVWMEMDTGRHMPVEPKATNVVVMDDQGRGKVMQGFIPHWVNCPHSDYFRRQRGKKNG